MRSEYKEWAAQYNESQPISFYNGAIAAWEHQQSKVDELQQRLDAALTILSSKKKMYVDMFIELEQALKGGEA